jgi:hypothetical protein
LKLLKIYFNDQIKIKKKNKIDNVKEINKKKKKSKIKKLWKKRSIRSRRLSTRRVYVGKGDLKHTNDKVIITFYLYNVESMYWSSLYRKELKKLYYPNQPLLYKIDPETVDEKKKKWVYNRWPSLSEYPYLRDHYLHYYTYLQKKIKKNNTNLNKLNDKLDTLKESNNTSQLNIKKLFKILMKKIDKKMVIYPFFSKYKTWLHSRYQRQIKMYHKLLLSTKVKYKYTSLKNFIPLIESFYNKKIIFNIVNLKKMHLNSDIYTQIVSMKLKNRNNKLYKVLKTSLRKIMVKTIYKINIKKNKPDRNKVLENKIRNNTISSMLNYNNCKHTLNNLLPKYFNENKWMGVVIKKSNKNPKTYKTKLFKITKYIIKNLRHGIMRGIRVEAKGRLTRRRTASRSIFKMKYMGGLKNIDSSFKKRSAIMLRGDRKSNVQYSIVNTNGRNGAFGVKGWVSSK